VVVVSVAQLLAGVISSYAGTRAATNAAHGLRSDVYEKIATFSGREHQGFGTPTLITRSTDNVQQIQVLGAALSVIHRWMTRVSRRMQDLLDAINRVLREQLMGLTVIRAFTRERFEADASRGGTGPGEAAGCPGLSRRGFAGGFGPASVAWAAG
jgi:ATP-binding cassette subfamily B protein